MADKRTIDIVLSLQDTEYKRKLQEDKAALALYRSELEVTNSALKGQEGTLDAMSAKYKALGTVLDGLKEQFQTERTAIENGAAAYGRAGSLIEEYKQKIADAEKAIALNEERQASWGKRIVDFKEQLGEAGKKVDEANEKFREAEQTYQKATNAVDALNEKYTGSTRNLPWFKDKMAAANEEVERARKAMEDAARGVEEANRAYTAQQAVLDADQQRFNDAGKSIAGYRAEIDNANKEIEKQGEVQRQAMAYMEKHSTLANKLQAEINKVSYEHETLRKRMEELKAAGVESEEEYKALEKEAAEYEKQLEKLEKEHELLEAATAVLVKEFGEGLVNAIKDCVAAYGKLETAMIGVSKTTNMSQEELHDLQEDFKALSTTIPVSASELAKIAELGGQLGVSNEGLRSFAETIANISVSTNLNIEEASNALAQFANIVGLTEQQYERFGSTIVALGNNFATDEKTIMQMSQRFASAGVSAELSATQIAAFAAAAGSLGFRAEAGGSSLAKLVETIHSVVTSGGEDLETFANIAGMTSKEFAKAYAEDAGGAIAAFLDGLGAIGPSMSNVAAEIGFGDRRVKTLVTSLALAENGNHLLTRALDESTDAFKRNVALQEEADKFYGSLENKAVLLNQALENLKSTVGEQLAPAMEVAYDAGADIITVVDKLFEKLPFLIPVLETIAGLTLTLATVSLPKTFDSVGKLVSKLGLLKENMTSTLAYGITSFAALSTEALACATVIGTVIAAVVALGIAERKRYAEAKTGYKEDFSGITTSAQALEKLKEHEQNRISIINEIKRANYEVSTEKTAQLDAETEMIVYLKGLYSSLVEAEKNGSDIVVDALIKEVDAYEAYRQSIYETINAENALFNTKKTNYDLTAETIIKNLESQIEWNNKYAENREDVLNRDIEGIQEWVATWDDGSDQAAEMMYALANTSDEQLQRIIDKYFEATEGAEDLSEAISGTKKAVDDANAAMEELKQKGLADLQEFARSGVIELSKLREALAAINGAEVHLRGNMTISSSAQGLSYVPYDDYPVLLHEGEMVLSRAEARVYRAMENVERTSSANNYSIVFNITQKQGESGAALARRINRQLGEVY